MNILILIFFMALLGRGIGECLPMTRLGHFGSLKLK